MIIDKPFLNSSKQTWSQSVILYQKLGFKDFSCTNNNLIYIWRFCLIFGNQMKNYNFMIKSVNELELNEYWIMIQVNVR